VRKRVFSTNAGDRIEFVDAEATSSRSNVSLSMIVKPAELAETDIVVEVSLTPKEATRFMELVQDVDAAIWSDEMGECADHDLTPVRCSRCGRYCGTKKRCPHCAPGSK